MSEITLDQVLLAVQSLPPEALAKLREILSSPSEQEQRDETARALASAASLRDFTADRQWLAHHRDEYAGRWVAVKHGELISASTDAKEVFATARATGHPDALFVFVEPRNGQPVINLG